MPRDAPALLVFSFYSAGLLARAADRQAGLHRRIELYAQAHLVNSSGFAVIDVPLRSQASRGMRRWWVFPGTFAPIHRSWLLPRRSNQFFKVAAGLSLCACFPGCDPKRNGLVTRSHGARQARYLYTAIRPQPRIDHRIQDIQR